MIISESILTTFESSVNFFGAAGEVEDIGLSLKPNQKDQVCPNLWNALQMGHLWILFKFY